MENQQETILAKERLHWGIFVPVLILSIVPALALTIFVFFVCQMNSAFRPILAPLQQAPGINPLDLIWLLPVVVMLTSLLLPLLATWISYKKSEITLTDRRLIFRAGFLSRHSGEVPLENVESICITESLPGRICGYGTVMVTTVGGLSIPLSFLGSPQKFHAMLQEAVLGAKNSHAVVLKQPAVTSFRQDDDARYRPKV